ncbi:hypothetical protein BCR35DRAFT_302556, partial [Leucosporidium creatinivorum]
MPPPPQPPKKSFPVSQFQQGPPHHAQSSASRPNDPHARRGAGAGGETPLHGAKRTREEQEQAEGEGIKGDSSKKKPKSFLPLNTFARDPPAPKPPKPPPAAPPPAPKLQRLPPPPPRAAPHRDAVKKRPRGVAALDLSADDSDDGSVYLEEAVAGPSKLEEPKERKLKTFTAFQRFDTPTKPEPKTPVALKPLPQFGNSSKATSERKPKKPLSTPPRAKPVYHSDDPPPSPLKPLLSTPPSARAASLFKSLGGPKVKEEVVGAKSLLDRVPPMPREVVDDEAETTDGIPDSWSPKKKKGGHILMGLASRASSILSSARTAQTLWLHNVSRQLTAHTQDQVLILPLLAKLLHPTIRLSVIEVLPFGSARVASEPTSSPSRRDERKVILARCRLARIEGDAGSTISSTSAVDLEIPGLVLFSLNEHPPASSQLGGVPRKKRDPEDDTRTVFVPSNPHDLRFIAEGAEVWIWDPMHRISLSTAFAEKELGAGAEMEGSSGSTQQPPASMLSEVGDVFWDSRTKQERQEEREAKERRARPAGESKEWALVCGRFAVV